MNKKMLGIILGVVCLVVVAVLVYVFVLQEKEITDDLATVMTKVYATVPEEETPMALTNIEVNDENIVGYLGTTVDYKEALASESMVGSIPHSVVLVRLNDGADIDAEMAKIKENVNPAKWVCVEAEEVKVLNKGHLVILIMSTSANTARIEQEFNNL